jgi:hypothetical protein
MSDNDPVLNEQYRNGVNYSSTTAAGTAQANLGYFGGQDSRESATDYANRQTAHDAQMKLLEEKKNSGY